MQKINDFFYPSSLTRSLYKDREVDARSGNFKFKIKTFLKYLKFLSILTSKISNISSSKTWLSLLTLLRTFHSSQDFLISLSFRTNESLIISRIHWTIPKATCPEIYRFDSHKPSHKSLENIFLYILPIESFYRIFSHFV